MISLPEQFERVIKEAPGRVPLLRHVNPESVLVLVHKMGGSKHGQNAGLRHARQGRVFAPIFPNVTFQGRDIRYAISFNPGLCTDFFKDKEDPIETVMHELWHIGTKCDGKLRRMKHGKQFNTIVKDLTETYYRNGGEPIGKIDLETRVEIRYWKNRQCPSIAFIRRGFLHSLSAELARIEWKEHWNKTDLVERRGRLQTFIPSVHRYACPNGHVVEANVKYRKARSCAQCSRTFDRRFLLSQLNS